MKKSNISKILKKYFAIAAIYLIISLTFFTAQAMAILNYDVSGADDISGFANRNGIDGVGDVIQINTTSDSNVSFVTTTGAYTEIPLDCLGSGVGNVKCRYTLKQSEINTNINNIQFMLQQIDGAPTTTNGNIIIDGDAPHENSLEVIKTGEGVLFKYSFTDYPGIPEGICDGSGIGHIELKAQGKSYSEDFTSKNCSIKDEHFINLSGTYTDSIYYSVIVRDRVGNEFNTGPMQMSGDFRPPAIMDTFKIIRNDAELRTFSSSANIIADVVVQVEDTNLSTLIGDLTKLNLNPAVYMNPDYSNAIASCKKESGNLWTCTFSNVQIQPGTSDIRINITATDIDGNLARKEVKDVISLKDSAGSVLYLGPLKTHCTSDLQTCYLKSGFQALQVELDTTSSYNVSKIIHLGVNSENRIAICQLEDVWRCTGTYIVPSDISSVNLVIAESYDDYGNILQSDANREIIIDDEAPTNITSITAVNNNYNNNCSVAGDELTFNVRVKEATPELRIYANTSRFTTKQVQKGSCTLAADNNFDCELVVKDFSSVNSTKSENITIEDLAGYKLNIPYKFEVCRSSSASKPQIISDVLPLKVPEVDRRTASYLPVKTYIPLQITIQNGATLMYLTIDRCTAKDINNFEIIGSGSYLSPNNGIMPTLVLNVGHKDILLQENYININCTLSARVKVGSTVYTQPETKDFMVRINTYNNSLGIVDNATDDSIKEVKKRINDDDKEIARITKIDNILGWLCRTAETIDKANKIAQDVKSAIYAVCIVLKAIPYTSEYADNIWKTVNKPLTKFHKLVDTYIWPPGMLPKGKPGIYFKYICLLYTCKHLDIGTYTGFIVDLAVKGLENVQTVKSNDKGQLLLDYGSITNPDGTIQKLEVPETQGYRKYFGKNVNYVTVGFSDMTDAQKNDVSAQNQRIIRVMDGYQWIINPYKSVHYDATCLPAKMYNYKKDRQINCMYLICLKNQVTYGLPKVVCDGSYKMNKCLYLDSAEYLLHDESYLKSLIDGIIKALPNMGISVAIQAAYGIGCKKYFTTPSDSVVTGWYPATCGLIGSAFSIKELLDYYKNNLWNLRGKDPAEKIDYCNAVDYKDEEIA